MTSSVYMDSTDPDGAVKGPTSLTRHSILASILLVFVVWIAYPVCQAIFMYGGDLRIPYLRGKHRHQVEASLGEPYRSYHSQGGYLECLHHLAHVSLRVRYDQHNKVVKVENPDLTEQ